MKPKTIANLIYWILLISIPISLLVSLLAIAAEGNNKIFTFVWNIDPLFIFAVFLAFIVSYPIIFLTLYIIIYTILKILNLIKNFFRK